jgi:hypothetical protein
VLLGAEYRSAKRHEQAWQAHFVRNHLAQCLPERRWQHHWRERRLALSPRNRSEKIPDQTPRFARIEVAGNRKHGIVGRVVGGEELRDVFQRCGGQIFHRPDQGMMKRMRGRKYQLLQLLQHRPVGLVVDRPTPFVFDDVALRVELLLRHRRQEVAHSIRLEPQRERELVRRNGLEVVGSLEPCGSVQRSAGALNELEVLVGSDVRGALKEHVLEEVRKSGTTFALVRRSHVIPDIHRYNRRGVIFGKGDEQSVVEVKSFYGNPHCRKLPAMESLWNPLCLPE